MKSIRICPFLILANTLALVSLFILAPASRPTLVADGLMKSLATTILFLGVLWSALTLARILKWKHYREAFRVIPLLGLTVLLGGTGTNLFGTSLEPTEVGTTAFIGAYLGTCLLLFLVTRSNGTCERAPIREVWSTAIVLMLLATVLGLRVTDHVPYTFLVFLRHLFTMNAAIALMFGYLATWGAKAGIQRKHDENSPSSSPGEPIGASWLTYLRNLPGALFSRDMLKTGIAVAAVAIIGLSTVSHYGFSTDEPAGIRIVWWNVDLIIGDKPIPGVFKYDGTIFSFTAEAAYQGYKLIGKGLSRHLPQFLAMEPRTKYLSRIADRIVVKHPLTFLVSLFAHVSVAAIVGILCGSRYAWIGVIVLALFPRFWGHSFFSPKDIPFAAFFTLSTCMGIYLIGQYLKAERQVKIGFNRITVATALYGILVGLLTGIRIGGLVVMFFVVIAHIGARLGKGNLRKDLSNVGALYVLMFATWLTTTILVYPASWSNPIGWFLEAIKLASSYDWPKEVLFDGRSIPAYSLPWYYLPKWIIITVPLPFQISFVLGLILNLVNYHKYSDLQQAAVLLILLQIFFLPILGIIKNSTMYDGMRHFFFILPGVAAISTTVFARFYEKLETGRRQAIAAIIAMSLVVPICLDMIALHPYEHVYFNRASGGLKNAHNRYETDYWGLSLREAMEWINEQGDPNRPVIVGGPFYSAAIYADPRITLMKLDNDLRENIDVPKPFYYLAAPKHGAPNVFPECEVIFQVVRQGIPLSIVKQCN